MKIQTPREKQQARYTHLGHFVWKVLTNEGRDPRHQYSEAAITNRLKASRAITRSGQVHHERVEKMLKSLGQPNVKLPRDSHSWDNILEGRSP